MSGIAAIAARPRRTRPSTVELLPSGEVVPPSGSGWSDTVVNLRSPWYDLENAAEEILAGAPAPRIDDPAIHAAATVRVGRFTAEELAAEAAPPLPLPSPSVVDGPPVAGLDVSDMPPQLHPLRRMWKGERLMHYNRLIALTLVVNAIVLWRGIAAGWWRLASPEATTLLADLVLVNFAVAILIRQHHVINLLFWLATRVPKRWPLAIRALCAKVYHFGGIHVGGAIAGTAWYALFAATAYQQQLAGSVWMSIPTLLVIALQLGVLLLVCAVSRRSFRSRRHDTFEIVKRLAGWASLLLFWAQTVLLARDTGTALGAWQTWVLALVTFSVALPWLRLRKVPVELIVPSNHVALARFDYGVTPFAGSSTALSRSPLLEWHSFANIPSPGVPGFRLTISRAGDWTGKLIDDRPSHVWVKGIPTAGVGNVELCFKKVVYVATGSGIGPCVPHLLANLVPARLVWATKDPRRTFGDPLVDELLAHQPDAVIWDTDRWGKPDLAELTYRIVAESGAEAVICIANKKVTWNVVEAMESRGIPAYGAIWDS